jgi:hypothetical protein
LPPFRGKLAFLFFSGTTVLRGAFFSYYRPAGRRWSPVTAHRISCCPIFLENPTGRQKNSLAVGKESSWHPSHCFSTESLYNTSQAAVADSSQAAAASSSQTSNPQTTADQASTAAKEDSVRLSEAAQAKLLYTQGQSVATIASSLGTTSTAFDNDLGITLEKAIEKTLEETLSAKA